MKLFGEYLVEKGVIRDGDLLDALLEQIETQPSVPKVAHEMGLLNPQEMLQTLKKQAHEGLSFIDAAKKLDCWSEIKNEKLMAELGSKRTPLGEILVKKKVMDLQTLTRSLDDFFGERARESGDVKPSAGAADIPLASALSGSEEVVSLELTSVFQECLGSLNKNALPSSDQLRQLTFQCHQALSKARLYGFSELGQMFERIETTLRETTLCKPADVGTDILSKLASAIKLANDIAGNVLEFQKAGKSIPDYLKQDDVLKTIKLVDNTLVVADFDLSSLEKVAES